MANENDKTQDLAPLRMYVAAAAQGLATTAVVHNLSAEQVAERAWEIGKRLYAWDMNDGERPPEPRRGGR